MVVFERADTVVVHSIPSTQRMAVCNFLLTRFRVRVTEPEALNANLVRQAGWSCA